MPVAKLVTSNAIKIEKGVPIPTDRYVRTAYPFEEMEVGDSFTVNPDKYATLRQSASARGARLGMKFKVSKMGSEVRCWRTA